MNQIIDKALRQYSPKEVLLLFSGGHDSLVSTHFCATYLKIKGVSFKVYHGDTTIGIQETQEYVKDVCRVFGWELIIRQPPPGSTYKEQVFKAGGFPGPAQHVYMMRHLKERALRSYVTHECKSSPYARENVLLITGIRSSESLIRMGYTNHIRKEGSRIWCNPIHDWSDKDCEGWINAHKLPRNEVKDKICISGECLCGCFAKPEEAAEIQAAYPDAWAKIEALQPLSPWKWGKGGKTQYLKHNPLGQIKIPFMPMCLGCEVKRVINEQ